MKALRPNNQSALARKIEAISLYGEKFRPVDGFSRYMVSNLGRVFSGVRSCRILKPTLTPQGYPYVTLMDDEGKPHKQLVHRLVATAFVPMKDGCPVVNHRNGNKLDPRPENLEWCTYGENNDHARDNGLVGNFGEKHYQAVLTEERVRTIRSMAARGVLHKDIAAHFGIVRQQVTKIVNRKAWARVA